MSIIPIMWAVSLLAAAVHIALMPPNARTKHALIGVVLLYQLIFTVGINCTLGFIAHTYFADETARFIGWPAGNPFQYEVAFANLTFGILGLLCIWFRGHFWTAAVVGISLWFLLDGIYHIYDLVVNGNTAPGNAGLPLYSDIIIPIVLMTLLGLYHSTRDE